MSHLSLHSDAVLQAVGVGGVPALPFGERHGGPITPLKVQVSLQVIQTQPQLFCWLWSMTRNRFGYSPLCGEHFHMQNHQGRYIWHVVCKRWSLSFYKNTASSQTSIREMLWKNHQVPLRNADFSEHKALYSRQEIFADFLWFRTTKWSRAWRLWMAVGVPPTRRSYWVQAMKTAASILEDFCWPIKCVHQDQNLQCQDWLLQTQGLSEVKR